ncbi:MAG TPA: RDD family protein [Candidatus Binatia bacterium]|nr:RDD family protein [Candidatus Binatia bacterium]
MQPSPQLLAPPGGRDRRDIVTPYAFQVHPRLLGLPLASPWKRLLAVSIDGVAVGALATIPGGFLTLVASLVLFRWAGRSTAREVQRSRVAIRWVAALAGVLGLWSLYGSALEVFDGAGKTGSDVVAGAGLAKLAIDIERKRCVDERCARGPLMAAADMAARQGWDEAKALDMVGDVLAELPVDDARRGALRKDFTTRLAEARKPPAADAAEKLPGMADVATLDADAVDDEEQERRPVHSLLAWARGLLDDLGIGLGWAALYFTAFCAWWDGQTPGKRLVNIRVVQLDGSPTTLWEAFERYGGYGAGFATGLLGFIQVLWDPNRQAIHDKICETVVIDGDVPAAPATEPA